MIKVLATIFIFLLASETIAQTDSIIINNFNTSNYQASSFNYAGIQSKDGIFYFANEDGILQYDGSEWRLYTIDSYSGVFSLVESTDNRLYVGGFNEFGYALSDSTGGLAYYSLRHHISSDSTIAQVWQTINHEGDIYFLSYERILRWDGSELHHIPLRDAFLFKVNSKLYASVFDGSIYLIESDNAVMVSEEIKFDKDGAFQILPGPDQKYVVFTSTRGLYLFDEKQKKVSKWDAPANDFLEKGYLYSALYWKDSLYVCSTENRGLLLINKKGEIVKNLTKTDGLLTNFLREPLEDKRGNLWVASNYGISNIQWPLDNETTEAPQSVITSYFINESRWSAAYIDNLQIDYDQPITFNYATPGFDKSELEYSSFLEGYEKNWTEWNNQVKRKFNNLNDGTYKFKVKSRVKNGIESQPAVIKFEVHKPWYLSRWLIAGAVITLIIVIYGIIKLRTLHLSRLNKQLEELVEERTMELVEQRERLQAMNKDLRIINTELDNFVYRSSHDLVAPLKSLKGLIHLAKLDNPDKRQMDYLEIMNNSVLRLEDFIKSIMHYSMNAKRSVDLQEVNLDAIIDEVRSEIKYFESASKVEFIKDYDENLKLMSDPSRLKIIFRNLITNSVKYHNYDQEAPFIKVSAYKNGHNVEVKICDNGLGISPEYLPKIFDMFFRASETSEGSGLGLYIVKDTVAKLGATISVESYPDRGTTFILLFS